MSESESSPSPSRADRSPTWGASNGSGDAPSPQDALIDQLPEAVIVVDADDRILFANAQAECMLGASLETLAGAPLSSLACPPDPHESDRETRCKLLSRDGTTHHVAAAASSVVYEGEEATLVTMRRLSERSWRKNTVSRVLELFDEAFHLGPAALLIVRLRDGLVLEISERLTEVAGLNPPDLVGNTLDELDVELGNVQPTELARELVAKGELRVREFQLRGADGSSRPLVGSARRVEIDGSSCALVSLLDVRELIGQLRDSFPEGASVRSALLSTVTHEVRTPLTCILGFTSVLREGVPDEYRRFVDLIDRSGHRLRRMLDSLLDLAQLEAGTLEIHPEVCFVEQLIRENARDVVGQARDKDLDLVLDTPDACIPVRVDPNVFGRVLRHLVGNAVKFTQRGRVSIRVEAEADDVTVVVADTGKGIDAASMDRVLQPFVQESEGPTRSHQGCGLGLTVSKRLLDRMNGRLEIESEKGEGTSVKVTLPRESALS